MSHELSWLIPEHVMLMVQDGEISPGESQEIADMTYNAIDALNAQHPVHVIMDLRTCKMQDRIWNYTKLDLKRHVNNGWTVVVADSRVLGLILAIFAKMLNVHLRYCDTPDEALKLLGEHHELVAQQLNA